MELAEPLRHAGPGRDSLDFLAEHPGGDRGLPEDVERDRLLEIGPDLLLQDGAGDRLLEPSRVADLVSLVDAFNRLLRLDALLERQLPGFTGSTQEHPHGGGDQEHEQGARAAAYAFLPLRAV